MNEGAVIRIPRRTTLTKNSVHSENPKPSRTRKERIVAVEFVYDDEVSFKGPRGTVAFVGLEDLELVADEDHTLQVNKFKRGGHPIRGWNWPIWGYEYKCACGENVGDREGHSDHLEEIAAKSD